MLVDLSPTLEVTKTVIKPVEVFHSVILSVPLCHAKCLTLSCRAKSRHLLFLSGVKKSIACRPLDCARGDKNGHETCRGVPLCHVKCPLCHSEHPALSRRAFHSVMSNVPLCHAKRPTLSWRAFHSVMFERLTPSCRAKSRHLLLLSGVEKSIACRPLDCARGDKNGH